MQVLGMGYRTTRQLQGPTLSPFGINGSSLIRWKSDKIRGWAVPSMQDGLCGCYNAGLRSGHARTRRFGGQGSRTIGDGFFQGLYEDELLQPDDASCPFPRPEADDRFRIRTIRGPMPAKHVQGDE